MKDMSRPYMNRYVKIIIFMFVVMAIALSISAYYAFSNNTTDKQEQFETMSKGRYFEDSNGILPDDSEIVIKEWGVKFKLSEENKDA